MKDGFAALLSAYDLDVVDAFSPETIVALSVIAAVNAFLIVTAVVTVIRDRRVKVSR